MVWIMEERLLKSYIEEMQKGNMEYFNAFYEETKKAVFYNIFALTKSHETSEDLLHDTYVKFLKEIKNIDLNKSIGGYLMMISKNITFDYFKKNNRIELNDEENKYVEKENKNELDQNLLLEKIKGILKEKEFQIFVLHALNDLTFEEIAKIIKRPLGTVIWSYNNSIKKIKKEVEILWQE